MLTINEVIVVEGKSDVVTLSNIIKAEYIITNGFEISDETIELIRKVNETKGVILFLDPDGPGEKIRMKIMNKVPNLKHAFVNPKHAKSTGFKNPKFEKKSSQNNFSLGKVLRLDLHN